ncbi:hypothetical protein SAMN04487866_12032 [Thermoactinomyces sp. DSM 45891]|uniref:hypothetical protein n=1 Tax=Thermoactinomyces sp. DSM 45891 TaxID=1761907 RepID=UPI00092460F3|nr:hypothetical protein [Thermoactinomyces sp. DSM 45891]SFX73027.1 hypothetical protein SAMN04487866_12032 [Thermoactinomyces sp. DSM 45891]
MRNEFYLEDHDPDQHLFEQPKPRRWRPSLTFFLIILVIAGSTVITYFITQTSSSTLTSQSSKPQPEPVKEPIADPSTQTEPAEPALVEPYRGDQAGFPELIAQVPNDDANKKDQPIKEQNSDQSITPEKEKMPITPKPKNQLSKENKPEHTVVNTDKQNISTQTSTVDTAKRTKDKQKSLNPEKQTVSPTQKHQDNPSEKQPLKTVATPEKQIISATNTQKTITSQTSNQPKILQQMMAGDQKQTTSIEKKTSSSTSASDKSIQWVVPNNPEENPSNQPTNTLQLETYLLNQAGELLPLLSTKTTEPKDLLKNDSTPFIQVEPPTRLDTLFLQIQNIQKFITQSTASEVHILINNGQKEPSEKISYIQTILTSFIRQSTQQANKKLILHKPNTQSTSLYFSLLENADGLSTQIEPITTIGTRLNRISTPPIKE